MKNDSDDVKDKEIKEEIQKDFDSSDLFVYFPIIKHNDKIEIGMRAVGKGRYEDNMDVLESVMFSMIDILIDSSSNMVGKDEVKKFVLQKLETVAVRVLN